MSTSQTVPPAGPTVELAVHAIDVTKTYGRGPAMVTALDRVSVAFGRGRFSVVMGASGSGKSTLLHCLAGLEPVDRGEVRLGDLDLTGLDDRRLTRLRRDRVGFVFQAFNLLPTLTAAENIELPLAIAGRRPTGPSSTGWWTRSGCATASATGQPSCPAASSSGSRPPAPWPAGRRWCSPTSPPATSTRGRAPSCSASCAGRSTSWARPW
jgi:ABC-type sugar transport system ATPase subunit